MTAEEYMQRLTGAARSIRDPQYSLQDFHNDMVACFPELRLYMATNDGQLPKAGKATGTTAGGAATSSGRTSNEEYLRTIGALFAVYWLMRLELDSVPGSAGLDGQRGFVFGVNLNWKPPSAAAVASLEQMKEGSLPKEMEKQLSFLRSAKWDELQRLVEDAGMLVRRPQAVEVDADRTASMLALTAIHDLMKVEILLPSVLAKHAPYLGHGAGTVIRDHDVALGYVLLHDAEALPCYAALPPKMRKPIAFTQAELGFNHGWLVQAEAPPGMLFHKLRQMILDQGL
eukprot:888148-Prymnesium_polylepis.1